jgi:hypothetical protein
MIDSCFPGLIVLTEGLMPQQFTTWLEGLIKHRYHIIGIRHNARPTQDLESRTMRHAPQAKVLRLH